MASQQAPLQPRLPRLEHVRNLYKDAAEMLPGDRAIRDKSGLVTALRNMTSDNTAARLREASSLRDGPPPLAAEEGPERPMSATSRSLMDLEASVNASTRRLNGLRSEADAKAKQAAKLESDLQASRSENKALDVKETPEGAKIAELEAEIDRVESEYIEQDYRCRQLQLMDSRLAGNTTAMDAHIKSMEDALAVSRKELRDIQSYLRQLENGKDQALHDLEAFHRKMQGERDRREKELAAKRVEFEQAKKAEAWRRQRENVRAELAAELAGDLSKEQEEELKATKAEKERLHRELEIERREREERAAALHEAFQQIKGITGVATLDEMAERFIGHEAARESLQTEREEAEQRLAAARAAVAKAEADLAELKATGKAGADADVTQEAFEEAEEQLKQGRAKLRRLLTASDRVQGMVVAVQQGAAGVIQRLQPFDRFLRPADDGGTPPGAAALSQTAADAFGFADRAMLTSPAPGDTADAASPSSPYHGAVSSMPPSPLGGLGAGGSIASTVTVAGGAGGHIDVQKQGREAYRLLSTAVRRLQRLVNLVESALEEDAAGGDDSKEAGARRRRHRRRRRRRRRRRSSTERGSSARLHSSQSSKRGEDAHSLAEPASDEEQAGEGDGGSGGSVSSFGTYSSYDSDDPRLQEKQRREEQRTKQELTEARERAKEEVMTNAPAFTLFGMRGRMPGGTGGVAERSHRTRDVLSLPLEDPVPHANNIRVQPAAVAAGGGGGGDDAASAVGSVLSSARSKAKGGGGGGGVAASVAGSPRGGDDDDGEDQASDDGKSIMSAGGGKAAIRAARRRRRRKEEQLPTHRALKDAARKRVAQKIAKDREEAYRQKHGDKLAAEQARKETLTKLTKTTRSPTGMDFLTRMPKLL